MKMKKTLSLVVLLVMVFAGCMYGNNAKGDALVEAPEYIDQSEDFEYRVRGSEAVITKYIGGGGTVFIPPTLGGKQVKTIPDIFTDVGEQEFGPIYCLVIPDGVTRIADSAFYGNRNLEEIYIPKSLTNIGRTAFSYCQKLESIHVDPENKNYITVNGVLFNKKMDTLIQYPAAKADADYVVPDGVKTIGGGAFSDSIIETITLPEGVTSIGEIAFWGCLELKTMNIPSTVSKIADSAFGAYNYKMENFVVAENNKWFTAQDGILYSKKMDTLIMYPNNRGSSSYVMPDTVKRINREALGNDSSLEEITFSSKLSRLEDSVVYPCQKLKRAIIQGKVTAIGNWAFGYAEDMYISIPASVKRISDEAFYECKNVTIGGKKGSYAEQYASQHGYQFVEED